MLHQGCVAIVKCDLIWWYGLNALGFIRWNYSLLLLILHTASSTTVQSGDLHSVMSFQGEGSTGNNTDSSEMLQAIRKTNGLLGDVKALMKTEFHKVFKEVDDFRKQEFDTLQCLENLFDTLFKNDDPMYLIQEWQLIKGRLHAVMDSRKGIENNLDNAADFMAMALKKLKSKMDESNFKMLPVAAQKRVVESFKLYEADLLNWKAECEQVHHFWNHNKAELMTSLAECNERVTQFLHLMQNSQRED